MTKQEAQDQALQNALNSDSETNYPAIYRGFAEMGIPAAEIIPRETVFTYNAWQRLGRQVRKGQHGVRIHTYIEIKADEKDPLNKPGGRKPRNVTVFHLSQTDAVEATQ